MSAEEAVLVMHAAAEYAPSVDTTDAFREAACSSNQLCETDVMNAATGLEKNYAPRCESLPPG
jgi:hypothetical protein